jgi:dimethylargininase
MFTALTRGVNSAISTCELDYLPRVPIDAGKAEQQHRDYEACLRDLGLNVISLPADSKFPDGLFVEDPAIVLDEIAVICLPGAASRRGEVQSIAEALAPFRTLRRIREPATIEGGDVMRLGKTLYCGVSHRTNREGAWQLAELTREFGYSVIPVPVTRCLHLKSAICPVSDDTLLANPAWIDMRAFEKFTVVELPADEPGAANVLRVGAKIVMPSSFPKTRELLERRGFEVIAIDISELEKAEAGVTCSSLIFSV